jgi:release factor glutamine methyltransferase
MNNLIPDNKVKTMHAYLMRNLAEMYDAREAANIAEVLFDAFKGWRKAEIVLNESTQLSESEMLKFHFALKKLKQKIPVQYVVGEAWFYGMKFHVDSAVLIPRPETEELVHMIITNHSAQKNLHVLDIGTGSGCIPVSLKKNCPSWQVHSIDVSEEALRVATRNAASNQVEVNFEKKDILTEIPSSGPFQLIVSNPPYIPWEEKHTMAEHVVNHEPQIALFVPNEDPLCFYRRTLELAKNQKAPCAVYFEIHHAMKLPLQLLAASFAPIAADFHTDMQGNDRMLVVQF